jgi:hypothetical protein
LKTLELQDQVFTFMLGFNDRPQDNEIRIENSRVGAGVRISGDRPLSFERLWAIRPVLAVEPFIAMTINPGSEFTWKMSFRFYTLPSKMK